MNQLSISKKNYFRFTVNAQTDKAQHFRIYDCLDRGYVIMTDGKVIGTADTLVQAQQMIVSYTTKVWCFNCYGVCIARMPIGKIGEYNSKHYIASERITSWKE